MRVLVASSSPSLRMLLRSKLRRDRRFAVVAETSDGDGVLALSVGYDLVLLDLRLPGLGVLGVMSRLRVRHPDRSIVVVASTSVPYLRYAALQEGAADYLEIPEELDDLPERLFACTQSSRHLVVGRVSQ
ncbi:MAG TPA: response regulator [Acidimicrobiales bacterium]